MIIDFSVLDIAQSYSGKVTFLNETAGFRNAFGMYKIDDDGGIYDVTVIFSNSSAEGSGGDLIKGESSFDVSFTANDKVGFFVAPNAYSYDWGALLQSGGTNYVMRNGQGDLANIGDAGPIRLFHVAEDGTETQVPALYGNRTWHSTAEASDNYAINGDATDHTIWDLQIDGGELVLDMRFEDLWAGGDMDYTDIVFRLDVGPENTLEAIDSGKDPATALTVSDRVVLTKGGSAIVDPLANDQGDGLFITHLNGEAVASRDSITLEDGEVVTLLEDGRLQIVGTDEPTDFDKLISYSVEDSLGATDTSVIALLTPAYANDDTVLVTSRGTTTFNVFANDELAAGGLMTLTEFGGQPIDIDSSITLASGTIATYLGDGQFTFGGADLTTDALDEVSYSFVDANGVSDTGDVRILTSPVDGSAGTDNFSGAGRRDYQGNMIDGADGEAEVVLGYGGHDKLFTGAGDDAVYGGAGDDNLRGEAGHDYLNGGPGDDLLSGGPGADTMIGGSGDDVYWLDDATDVVMEGPDADGHDMVKSRIDHLLAPAVEDLWLIEGSAALVGEGNASSNFIRGNENANILSGHAGDDTILARDGDDSLSGGAGDDLLQGEDGNDTIVADLGADMLHGGEGDDLLLGGDGNDTLCPNVGDDISYGGSGDDLIAGGPGADTMYGGAGNDRYKVDNVADVVIEAADEGVDWVHSTVGFVLSDHVEHLRLQGASADIAIGNGLDNRLIGTSGANDVIGRGGDDRLSGRGGKDTLRGGGGDDTLNGGGGRDELIGGSGADKLRGAGGADLLDGGKGNDKIFGGGAGDVFVFRAGDGHDTVKGYDSGLDEIQFLGVTADDITIHAQGRSTKVIYNGGSVIFSNTTEDQIEYLIQ